MKIFIQKAILSILLILPCHAFSQLLGYTQATDMDVSDIFIGGTYTKTQVEAKWGVPTLYRSSVSENGLNEIFDYSENQFLFGENGIFHSFVIETSDFVVYAVLNGGIKVGDKIKVLKFSLPSFGKLVSKDENTYHLFVGEWDDPIVIKHAGGRVTQISFVTSI